MYKYGEVCYYMRYKILYFKGLRKYIVGYIMILKIKLSRGGLNKN